MSTTRKPTFKSPPATAPSQEARRIKALEEQKRRRAEKVDSARQLDIFANLNLGGNDSDADDEHTPPDLAIAPYLSIIHRNKIPDEEQMSSPIPQSPEDELPITFKANLNKGKNRKRHKNKSSKSKPPNRWANACMYAELLEMNEDDTTSWVGDGLPNDLENSWIALAPVPVGKRCIVVTHESSGLAGVVPNTTLRSRVLGKSLMPPFPSPVPPLTTLDCILDPNWRDNGLLHVLDVVKWKSQDIADCETPFRMWWRDTRIAELPRTTPPAATNSNTSTYQFPYPVTFSPIPYHTNTTHSHLQSSIIPLARSIRLVNINLPVLETSTDMDIDSASGFSHGHSKTASVSQASVNPDGLLLYVSKAAYEPGTSPLSTWVPINAYDEHRTDVDAMPGVDSGSSDSSNNSPLGMFERLIKRRLDSRT